MSTDEKDDFIQATMDMMLEGEISKLSLIILLIIIIVSDAIANDSIAGNSDDEWFFVPDQTPKHATKYHLVERAIRIIHRVMVFPIL